jgi:hypothetical protein
MLMADGAALLSLASSISMIYVSAEDYTTLMDGLPVIDAITKLALMRDPGTDSCVGVAVANHTADLVPHWARFMDEGAGDVLALDQGQVCVEWKLMNFFECCDGGKTDMIGGHKCQSCGYPTPATAVHSRRI